MYNWGYECAKNITWLTWFTLVQGLINLHLCSCSCLGNSDLALVLLHFLLHHPSFMHMHRCISFSYARCKTCGREVRGVGAEPQDDVRWASPEDGRIR